MNIFAWWNPSQGDNVLKKRDLFEGVKVKVKRKIAGATDITEANMKKISLILLTLVVVLTLVSPVAANGPTG